LKAHPGSVKTTIGIDLPRYRDPLSPEFVHLQREIMQALA